MNDQSADNGRAVEVSRQVVEALQKGVELRQQGDLEGALAAYQEAAALPDAPAAVFFNLGNVLFDQGQWAQALTGFSRALALQPDFAGAWLQTARCQVRLEQLVPAR